MANRCSTDDCPKYAQTGCDGMCVGCAKEIGITRKPMKKRECSVPGCEKWSQNYCLGMCVEHFRFYEEFGMLASRGVGDSEFERIMDAVLQAGLDPARIDLQECYESKKRLSFQARKSLETFYELRSG